MPVLSGATSVRLGTAVADRLYLGTSLVWSSVSGRGALVASTPMPSGALTGTVTQTGALAGRAPMPYGTLTTAGPALTGALAAATPMPRGALTGTVGGVGPETFDGANGAAWPSPWTGASGATADQQSGAGRLVTTSGVYSQTFIRRTAPDDAELVFRWKWQGPGSTVDIAIRGAGTNYGDNPKWTYRHLPDAIWLNGASALLDTATTTHTVDTWYVTRIRWQGTTVQGRTWLDGTGEPTGWMVEATDAGSPTSGYLIFRTENFVTGAATALFDDVAITDLTPTGTSGALAGVTPMPTGALTGTTPGGPSSGFGSAPFGASPFGA